MKKELKNMQTFEQHKRFESNDFLSMNEFLDWDEVEDGEDVRKSKKSYYHLQQSEDGKFTHDSTIAWIESDTTKEERIKLANYYTNGQFTKYPMFYRLVGPIDTPFILSLSFFNT